MKNELHVVSYNETLSLYRCTNSLFSNFILKSIDSDVIGYYNDVMAIGYYNDDDTIRKLTEREKLLVIESGLMIVPEDN